MTRRKHTPTGPEYHLFVTAVYKDTEQEYRTLVVLQTARQFASFRYELSVEEKLADHAISYRVTGLRAPQLSLPGSGPASFRREYRNLRGKYRITVEGLDRTHNIFEFEIGEKQVMLKQAPSKPFVEVSREHHGTQGLS